MRAQTSQLRDLTHDAWVQSMRVRLRSSCATHTHVQTWAAQPAASINVNNDSDTVNAQNRLHTRARVARTVIGVQICEVVERTRSVVQHTFT
jgi:exoribonuclease II